MGLETNLFVTLIHLDTPSPSLQTSHGTPHQFINIKMPTLSLPVPLATTAQKDNFTLMKIWNGKLDKLVQVPEFEYKGLPQDMVDMEFARFQTPLPSPMEIKTKTYRCNETIINSVHIADELGPHFQSQCLENLNPFEVHTAYHMCLSFQLRPCKTNVQQMHLVNSFSYVNKNIAEAYKGASWAFPVKTYNLTHITWIHYQGFKILRHAHFPPHFFYHLNLEHSLEPSWLPPQAVMDRACSHFGRHIAPSTGQWNKAFNSHHCSLFKSNPAVKMQVHFPSRVGRGLLRVPTLELQSGTLALACVLCPSFKSFTWLFGIYQRGVEDQCASAATQN